MKTTILATLAHLLPPLCIGLMAGYGESENARVIATVVLFVSSLVCGYFHGLNRTHKTL